MTKAVKISMVLLMVGGISVASDKMYQKFGIQSGKVTYKVTGSMNMMGTSSKTLAKKRVIFSDFGIKELREESKVVKQNGKITKSHTITYMNKAIIYNVDFNAKRITRMQNPGMIMLGLSDNNTAQQAGLKMLKQMGGKKVGKDTILGHECDIWEAMGTKQCIYKGLPLKTESDIMGVMDKLATMDASDQKNAAKTTGDFAAMAGMFAAAASSAGVKNGSAPTADQEKKMEQAMMSAMFPKIKGQILAQEKSVKFGRECISKADTLKEANICNQKMVELGGEKEDDFEKWNPEMKKEILGYLDQSISRMECIKKANNMNDMDICMPKEQ